MSVVATLLYSDDHSYTVTIGYLPVVFMIESIMDHLALSLKMDPCALKELNLYKQGDVSYVVSNSFI